MFASVLAVAAAAGGIYYSRTGSPAVTSALWRETGWPLARDQYPAGKAYECTSGDCQGIRVTFRAKIGFCNCATGVSDDEELERVGDLDLVDTTIKPLQTGREIAVAHMKGRSRIYSARQVPAKFLSIAFNDRCDVIVATATGADNAHAETQVINFLNSRTVVGWAERALGL